MAENSLQAHVVKLSRCKSDCFACFNGKCYLLNDNNFGTRKCPFYKKRDMERGVVLR